MLTMMRWRPISLHSTMGAMSKIRIKRSRSRTLNALRKRAAIYVPYFVRRRKKVKLTGIAKQRRRTVYNWAFHAASQKMRIDPPFGYQDMSSKEKTALIHSRARELAEAIVHHHVCPYD